MSEWKECKLGDVCEFQEGYVNPSQNFSEYFDGNIKWLRATDLNNGNVYNTSRTLTEKGFLSAGKSAKLFKPNTIGISKSGTIGRLGILKDYMCGNRAVINIAPSEKVNTQFIYYSLLNRQEQFEHLAVGSVQKNLYVPILAELKIKLPSISKQNEIVKVLSSFDDKIELNDQINRNLEEQAQAIFKNWFVDFEPFGGEKPDDWKETSLGDVCLKITDGSHFSPQDNPSAPYPMYSVKDMETYGFNPSNCKHISAEDFAKMKAGDCIPQVNDILVAKDGSYLKEIFICSENREEAILSSIAIFRPNTDLILPEILLFLLKQPTVRKDVGDNFVSGSALPRIVLKDFKKYRFILPSMQAQQKLASLLSSIRQTIQSNVGEIHRLAALRNSLLPKLMTGEIDIAKVKI